MGLSSLNVKLCYVQSQIDFLCGNAFGVICGLGEADVKQGDAAARSFFRPCTEGLSYKGAKCISFQLDKMESL